jgi:putative DNA primase/helicase
MGNTLHHAHLYLSLGLAVLPLHFPFEREGSLQCSCGKATCRQPAKHPFGHLAKNGLKDSSRDPETVQRWFDGRSLNIGIATGTISGIIALDVDPRHDGDTTLAGLEAEHGPLPPTWRFLTGGGGEHILFRHPGGTVANSAGLLGPGLDVRGDGGYIVAPPSRHISRRAYAISVDHHPNDVLLAPPPEWLMQRLSRRKPAAKDAPQERTDWRGHVGATHVEGTRNTALASLTGHLLRNRVDPFAVLDLMLCWNRAHCNPPLDDDEVSATVRSIARKEIDRREAHHAH